MARTQLSIVLVALVAVVVLVFTFLGRKPETPRTREELGGNARVAKAPASPPEEPLEPVPEAADEGEVVEEASREEVEATSEEVPAGPELPVRVVRAKADPQTPPQSVVWGRSWQAQAVIQDWPALAVLTKKLKEDLRGKPIEAVIDAMGCEPDRIETDEDRTSWDRDASGEQYVYIYTPYGPPELPDGEEAMPELPWCSRLLVVRADRNGQVYDVRDAYREDPPGEPRRYELPPVEARQPVDYEYYGQLIADNPKPVRPYVEPVIDPVQVRALEEVAEARKREILEAERVERERILERRRRWEREVEAQKDAWAEEYGIEP